MHPIRSWLYIGSYRESQQLPTLKTYGITAVLQLAEAVNHPGIISAYVDVEDGVTLASAKLERGVAFIRAQKAAGKTVLVACGAGISRSVAFSIAALKEEEGLSLADAYLDILKIHDGAMPHSALWESLRIYYDETTTFREMLDRVWEQRKNEGQT